jgi:CheY-like chemotaxis protein
MDEDTKRRCLEPFFTTKGERGTGLGLAMVYGMVQRHSAELQIETAPGKGTIMRLMFPIAADKFVPSPAPATLPVVAPLKILLVDDDPLIIASLANILQGDGHTIATADGGQAGIDTFLAALKRGEHFDIVITDLGMPYVDGRRVAAAVHGACPQTAIVMLTGWGQRLVAENDVPTHVDRVLSKPPKLRELRAALAELSMHG